MTSPTGEIHRGVDVLRVAEVERPVSIDDDVLVRVHASAVTRGDTENDPEVVEGDLDAARQLAEATDGAELFLYSGDSYLFAAVRSRSANVTIWRQPERVMDEHDLRHVVYTPDLYDERTFTELVEGVAYARNTVHRGRPTAEAAELGQARGGGEPPMGSAKRSYRPSASGRSRSRAMFCARLSS